MAESGSDRVLLAQPQGSGAEYGVLTLFERAVPLPSPAARVRYWLYTKPPAGADSTLALYLTNSRLGAKHGAVVWMVYEITQNEPVLVANVESVHGSDLGHVVLARSTGARTTFSIYKVELKKAMVDIPFHLDPEQKEQWPGPSKPISEQVYEIPKEQASAGCVITAVDLSTKGENLSIRAHRQPRSCGYLATTFDQSSAHWSRVEVHEETGH